MNAPSIAELKVHGVVFGGDDTFMGEAKGKKGLTKFVRRQRAEDGDENRDAFAEVAAGVANETTAPTSRAAPSRGAHRDCGRSPLR